MDYLLRPSPPIHAPRPGPAIAILVIYSLLLYIFVLTYARLLYTVIVNPGYVSRSSQWCALHENKSKRQHKEDYKKRCSRSSDGSTGENAGGENAENGTLSSHGYAGGVSTAPANTGPAPSLQDFYARDAFICQADGRPKWCSTCLNWKSDRAHHCREVERCVRKMDHFCPWYVPSHTSKLSSGRPNLDE